MCMHWIKYKLYQLKTPHHPFTRNTLSVSLEGIALFSLIQVAEFNVYHKKRKKKKKPLSHWVGVGEKRDRGTQIAIKCRGIEETKKKMLSSFEVKIIPTHRPWPVQNESVCDRRNFLICQLLHSSVFTCPEKNKIKSGTRGVVDDDRHLVDPTITRQIN